MTSQQLQHNYHLPQLGFDFYQIDKGMFAPAEVVINDLTTGKLYKEGFVNAELLKKSFGIE